MTIAVVVQNQLKLTKVLHNCLNPELNYPTLTWLASNIKGLVKMIVDVADCVNAGATWCDALLIVPLQCCSIKSTWQASPLVTYWLWLRTHLQPSPDTWISTSLRWDSTQRPTRIFFHYLFSFFSPRCSVETNDVFTWPRRQQHIYCQRNNTVSYQ